MNNQSRSVSWPAAVAGLFLVLAASPAFGQGISPPFEAATVVADNQSRFESLLDYDGDGRMDAVSVWFPTSVAITVKGFRNDGTGKLVQDWAVTYSSIQNPPFMGPVAALGVGDFNGDNQDDFVLTLNEYVGYWISNGAGQLPTVTWLFPEPDRIAELVTGDVDGDGRTDVVLREAFQLRVFLTQASGLPVLSSSVQMASAGNTHIFKTDADGDGLDDVGTIQDTGTAPALVANVSLYPLPAGVAQAPLQFQFVNVNQPMVASGDVDGDGDVDVVAFSMPLGNAPALYQLARRTGPGTFTVEPQTFGGPATHLVDLDFDGDLDGACCGGGGGGPAGNVAGSKFEIAVNLGNGAFAPAFIISGLGAAHFAGASDLDQDGDVDLIAGRCVYYSRGPGGIPPYSAAGGVVGPRDLVDVDGDGDPDAKPGLATFAANSGNGNFAPQSVVAPPPPAGMSWALPGFPGDFDGDGDVDLLCDTIPPASAPNGTHLLLNLGGAAYVDAGPAVPPGMAISTLPGVFSFVATPNEPENSVVADLDLDGDLDLIVRAAGNGFTNGSGNSKIWINTGGGSFIPGVDLTGIVVLYAGLVDSDGIVDLVVQEHVASGFSRVAVMKGTGAGYLPPGPPLDSNSHVINRPAVFDYDGDGDVDVVSFGFSGVKRIRNLGNSFEAAVSIPNLFGPPAPTSVSTPGPFVALPADIDGDGLMDVVVSPLADAAGGMAIVPNSVLVNPGSAGVTVQIFTPRALADLDGDGDQDAVGAFNASRNNRFGPSGAGRRVQYGAGIAGSGGLVPVLGESGPFRAGQSAEIRIRGGLGGASGLLAIGYSAANVPALGGTLLLNPTDFFDIQLGGPPGVAGAGGLTIPFVVPASIVGIPIFHQAGFFDAGAPAGISGTNGLEIEVGP